MRTIVVLVGLLWVAQACTFTGGPATLDLAEYRWKQRLLLVFAPSDGAAMREQEQLLTAMGAGIAERDLLIGRLHPDGGTFDGRRVSSQAVIALRERLGVAGDFAAVLIGKDGGVKARYTAPVAAADLFPVIDAMPMRQREQRDS